MKKALLLLTLLTIGRLVSAQTTNVTLNVTDAGGQTWNNGTYRAQLTYKPSNNTIGPFYLNGVLMTTNQTLVTGALNGSGSATFTLSSNTSITPSQTVWVFQICPQATSPCATQSATITGTTQTVSAVPPAIAISCGPNSLAYLDSEVSCGIGGQYFNLLSGALRFCQASSGNVCTIWFGLGGTTGTVTYTANQTASTADSGKLVEMNCSSACAYTLPNPQPSSAFYSQVTSIGSILATVTLSGGMTFYGSSTVPLLAVNELLTIYADGQVATNYLGGRGSFTGPPASSFNANTYIQSTFTTSTDLHGCLNSPLFNCSRSIYEVDTNAQANSVGFSSVAFANHPSGNLTNFWGGEADVSLANTGTVTTLAGWTVGVHLRGSGSHGTVTNGINFNAIPCDLPDAAASTFTNCYAFYAGPTLNATNNFGFYQGPNTNGTGLAGTNVFSDQLQVQQGLTATNSNNYSSPNLALNGSYWTGSAGAGDTWALNDTLGAGATPLSVLNITHSGSPTLLLVQVPSGTSIQTGGANTGGVGTSSNYFGGAFFGAYNTGTNCQLGGASGTTSPAACGSSAAGMIAIPASQTTYTVNTTRVTANSEIIVQQMTDASGLPSGPTCNNGVTAPLQSARTAGTSFTIALTSVASVTCIKYLIIN